MIFRTRKGAITAGILVVAIAWIMKGPLLVQWVSEGLLSVVSFLLLFFSVASILVGCLLMKRGKPSRRAFVLHIASSVMACVTTHFFFVTPLALGVSVAVTALIWPASNQRVTASEHIDPDANSI